MPALPANATYTTPLGVVGRQAMVVSAHPLASEVGSRILKQGGNAWDAAIAVQFALAVVYPVAGNIGGGGFAVFREKDGSVGSLDFREKAPLTAHRNMYLDDQGEVVTRGSLEGHLAAGVPGSVDGMVTLYGKYGSLPWSTLIQPSIDLAANGFTLSEEGSDALNQTQELFSQVNTFEIGMVKKEHWQPGQKLIQPELSKTLTRIRDQGRDGFYSGETASLIIDEMKRGGGIISFEDLQKYHSTWRDPLIGNYRGHRIISMPPPSSGGVALLQLLEGIEPYPVARYGHNQWRNIHLMTEIEKRVYADRATYLGDPDFYQVPVNMLLDTQYLKERMSAITLRKSTPATAIKEGNVRGCRERRNNSFFDCRS